LTDDPKEWVQHEESIFPGQDGCWQNKRRGEAFSTDGGKTYYLLSEGGNQNNPNPIHYSMPHIVKPVSLTEEFLKEDK
jgi:hypothetical protein